MTSLLAHIPTGLVVLRAIIAPLLLLDALDGKVNSLFLPGYVVAFLSDVIDGSVARYLKVTSNFGATIDSCADLLLNICVVFSIFLTHGELAKPLLVPLYVGLFSLVLNFSICLTKFRKIPSYHSYLAKAVFVLTFFSVLEIFWLGTSCYLAYVTVVLWILTNCEDIAISLILPHYATNVSGIPDAIEIRKAGPC